MEQLEKKICAFIYRFIQLFACCLILIVLHFSDEPSNKKHCRNESADSLTMTNPCPTASTTSPGNHSSCSSSLDKSLERCRADLSATTDEDDNASSLLKCSNKSSLMSPHGSAAGSSYASCQYGMPTPGPQQQYSSLSAACQQAVYYPHHSSNMQQTCGQLPSQNSSACALAAAAVSHPLAGYSMPPPPHQSQSSCAFMGVPSQSGYPGVSDISAMNLAYKAAAHFSTT